MIRVNIDYESMLFHGKPGPQLMNTSLEFLAFFVTDKAVLSDRTYSQDYLNHVARLTGKTPEVRASGTAENWWGKLKDISEERFLNSKITSTELSIVEGWSEAKILNGPPSELPPGFLIKDPFSMSGRGFIESERFTESKTYPLILEPKLDRRYDFSHYVFPYGKVICYENIVDEKFQYKGSLFRDLRSPTIEALSFFSEVSSSAWEEFRERFEKIRTFYDRKGFSGYSVDSFVYRNEDELKVYPLSEVNYRRTMGLLAYEIALQLDPGSVCAKFFLLKPQKEFYKEQFPEGIFVLSPGDTRFDIALVTGRSLQEIEAKEAIVSLRAGDRHRG